MNLPITMHPLRRRLVECQDRGLIASVLGPDRQPLTVRGCRVWGLCERKLGEKIPPNYFPLAG